MTSRITQYRICAAPTAQILANLRESVFAARRAGCTDDSVRSACRSALAYAKLADRITSVGRRTRSAK